MIKSAALIFLICFSFISSSSAQIESVGIVSKWSGLGKREESMTVVAGKGGKYYAEDGRKIPNEFIRALERAISAPEISALNFDNLGITQAWLNKNAAPAFPECCTYNGIWATTKQKQLFNQIFRNKMQMEKIIGDYLSGSAHTDDYPLVEVTIKSVAGTIKISSEKQAPLMLPWAIEGTGKASVTYNSDISRTLVNLLPAEFTNRDRVSGKKLRPDVSVLVMDEVFKAQRRRTKKRS